MGVLTAASGDETPATCLVLAAGESEAGTLVTYELLAVAASPPCMKLSLLGYNALHFHSVPYLLEEEADLVGMERPVGAADGTVEV